MKPRLDRTDFEILKQLQTDARLSMRELARRVALSAPAVSERVERLEEAGIVVGYMAQVNPLGLGRTVLAFIGLKDSGQLDPLLFQWARERDGVQECYSLTGEHSCMLKVAVASIAELNNILAELIQMGFTCETSLILDQPVAHKAVL